jgi:hypothetical protein
VDDTVTCLVRGPASRYPRGFVWLIPAWFAIISYAAVRLGTDASSTGQMPLWLGLTEVGGLVLAACTLGGVLATVRHRAFRADSYGIWLGIRTTRRRPKLRQVHLAWPEIAQLRMVPRRYGVLLEITLSPAARIVHRPGPVKQVLLFTGALLLPFVFGRGTPALTTPRLDPPRYQIKICDLTAAELKQALAAVQPDALPVRVLTRRGALRFTVPPPSRKPVSQRPPSPVG